MNRNKNTFRAIRERVGITQAALARTLGVAQRSVRYWEDADSGRNPPDAAWRILEDALREQQRGIAFALQKVESIVDERGEEPMEVQLPYWLDEQSYLERSTDAALGVAGDWRMANANIMALAIRLEERGIIVTWTDGNPARPE